MKKATTTRRGSEGDVSPTGPSVKFTTRRSTETGTGWGDGEREDLLRRAVGQEPTGECRQEATRQEPADQHAQ
jgi:hypothetical protein